MILNTQTFIRSVAFLLALLLLTTGCSAGQLSTTDTEPAPSELAEPAYPTMAGYPDEQEYIGISGTFDDEGFQEVYSAWRSDQQKHHDQPEGYADNLQPFFRTSIPLLLEQNGENAVCSPLNIYMALALLAESTGGSSRQQILDALQAADLSALRAQAGQVWSAHYNNDGANACVLANSLWLKNGLEYNDATVRTLAEHYYASVFQGPLGTPAMTQALRDWLNDQTDGLLSQQAGNLQLPPDSLLALASTIYYRARWGTEFRKEGNTDGIFHAPSGDRDAVFMNRSSTALYYWGEDFGATALSLKDGSTMWLLLPDEGKTPADVLAGEDAAELVLGDSGAHENQKRLMVHLSLPKFDISADLRLNDSLASLGITDAFGSNADFRPILPASGAWLDSVQHAARVAIDEEGVTAAAYTVMTTVGAAPPPKDEIYLTFDRPFLFVITSHDDLPLFAGVVNEP